MLLSRYSNIDYVLNLSVEDGSELIIKAYQQKAEERAFKLYTVKYQNMDEKTYKPFVEFYNPKKQTRNKSEKEILDEVKEILSAFKKEGEEIGNI